MLEFQGHAGEDEAARSSCLARWWVFLRCCLSWPWVFSSTAFNIFELQVENFSPPSMLGTSPWMRWFAEPTRACLEIETARSGRGLTRSRALFMIEVRGGAVW